MMGLNIKWCSCERLILTSGQIERNEKCEICQKEHAESLKKRMLGEDKCHTNIP